MAAVIDIATAERLQGPSERRTHLRVIPGGLADDDRRGLSGARGIESARTVSARTYLVRRIAVLSVAVVLLVATAYLLAATGRALLGALDAAPVTSGRVHVVSEGDTAWSLAGRYAPSMDRRAAVDELLALNGHDVLRVGEELSLPASFG